LFAHGRLWLILKLNNFYRFILKKSGKSRFYPFNSLKIMLQAMYNFRSSQLFIKKKKKIKNFKL